MRARGATIALTGVTMLLAGPPDATRARAEPVAADTQPATEPAPAPAAPAIDPLPAVLPSQSDAAAPPPPPPSPLPETETDLAKRLCRARGALTASAPDTLFGHYAFRGAAAADLVSLPRSFASGSCTRLRGDAAAALRALMTSAQAEAPPIARDLFGLSCHRTTARQAELYCRAGQIAQRGHAGQARWIAPPGFSEHATGLAIDFGARSARGCDLLPCFASTPAGRWLAANAPRFGFEMSFPEGNTQGVVFEPWHFRYVGAPDARATFARAVTPITPVTPPAPAPPPERAVTTATTPP